MATHATGVTHDPANSLCGCPECVRRELNIVAAMCRPIQPDHTRAMAVLEALRAS